MKIETGQSRSRAEQAPEVEALESRLLRAAGSAADVTGNKRPDLDFEDLYQQLWAMEGQGEKAMYEFLKSLRANDGITPRYPNAEALMDVTLKLMFRLRDEGLEKSALFKEIKGANSLAFSMSLFVKSYMRDVFQPLGDDAWEKSEW